MIVTWPRASLGLGAAGIDVEDAHAWLARMSATVLALIRCQAGWIASAPNLALVTAFAERLSEDADHADFLFKRQYGLRAFPSEMIRDSRIVPAWVVDLEAAPCVEAFLFAVYRVVKPRLLVEFRRYRVRTAPNADGPTIRQIDLIDPELADQVAWGIEITDSLTAGDPVLTRQAADWAAAFEQRLVMTGGFFGESVFSDAHLWRRNLQAPTDALILRRLARVVYRGYDLPWDAVISLTRYVGDLGRHARQDAGRVPAGDAGRVAFPDGVTTDLIDELWWLATCLGNVGAEGGDETDRFGAEVAQSAAACVRDWAQRLTRAREAGDRRGRP